MAMIDIGSAIQPAAMTPLSEHDSCNPIGLSQYFRKTCRQMNRLLGGELEYAQSNWKLCVRSGAGGADFETADIVG